MPNRSEPLIRAAEAADALAVRQCVVDAFTPYVERFGFRPRPLSMDFEARIAQGHVWVAVVAEVTAGALVQYETPQGFYVDTVASSSAHRGTGVGRALLEFAEREALRRGFDSVCLATNSKMAENQALYTKVGYVEQEREHLDGYDRIFYRKPLAGGRPGSEDTVA